MKKLQLLALTMLLSTSVMVIPSAPAVDLDKVTEQMTALVAATKADMTAQGAKYDYNTLINNLAEAESKMLNLINNLIQSASSMQNMQKMKTDTQARQAAKVSSVVK